eukprot:1079232-Pyramimonas_sp.AAC.1
MMHLKVGAASAKCPFGAPSGSLPSWQAGARTVSPDARPVDNFVACIRGAAAAVVAHVRDPVGPDVAREQALENLAPAPHEVLAPRRAQLPIAPSRAQGAAYAQRQDGGRVAEVGLRGLADH